MQDPIYAAVSHVSLELRYDIGQRCGTLRGTLFYIIYLSHLEAFKIIDRDDFTAMEEKSTVLHLSCN